MQISDNMVEAALRGWCGYGPDVDLSTYQQSPETKEAWRRALEAAFVAMYGDASDFVKQLKDSAYWQSNEDYAKAAACIEDLAAALRSLSSGLGEDDPSWHDMGLAEIVLMIGDLRRARATLEKWGLK